MYIRTYWCAFALKKSAYVYSKIRKNRATAKMLTFYYNVVAGLDAPECAGHCDARRPNSVHRLRQKAGGQVQKRGQVLKLQSVS